MSRLPNLLRGWFDHVRSHGLTTRGQPAEIGSDNLWTFSADDEQRRSLMAQDIAIFLRASAAFWRDSAAPLATDWLFYAWHDALSGQLSFSACPARTLSELPFGCKVRAVQVDDVARAFLEGRGIIRYRDPQRQRQRSENVPGALDVWAEPYSCGTPGFARCPG